MNIIQPPHMNDARMGTVSVCIWRIIGKIGHCAIEIINGVNAATTGFQLPTNNPKLFVIMY